MMMNFLYQRRRIEKLDLHRIVEERGEGLIIYLSAFSRDP